MCKGSSTTSTTTAPNAQAGQAYSDLLNRASGVASTPYQGYSGELVAPVNGQQFAGIGGINANAGFASPYISQATQYANQAAQPITGAQISQYQNPYTQQVVNATEAQFNQQNQMQQSQLTGNAAAQGALGGDRVGVAQGTLGGQQQMAEAPVIAGLESQGYNTALSTALQEQQNTANAAFSLGNLGVSGQNAALQGAGAQLGAGSLEQQTQQALDTALYGQFQNQLAFPYQQTQWLAGLDTGVGSQMGGTSSTTAPPPSLLGQLFGVGLTGAGIVGGTGGFGSSGWLTGLMASDKRLKHNISKIGKTNDGQPIYRYQYKGSPEWHVGLMAQEVEGKHPEAVHNVPGFGDLKFLDMKEATDSAVKRRYGGIVPGFDIGGGVDVGGEFGAGSGSNIGPSPWAGAHGYVPGIQIVPGRGAPPPPNAHQDTTTSDMMKQVQGLSGLFKGANRNNSGSNSDSNILVGGQALGLNQDYSAPSGILYGNAALGLGEARGGGIRSRRPVMAGLGTGGMVRHFADGGGDDSFLDRFAAANDFSTPSDLPPASAPGIVPPSNPDALAAHNPDMRDALLTPEFLRDQAASKSPPASAPAADTAFRGITPSDQLDNEKDRRAAATWGLLRPNEPIPDYGTGAGFGDIVSAYGQQPPPTTVPDLPPATDIGMNTGRIVPRGIRNNNPGNIEDGGFARSQPGYVGNDGRFAQFDSPQAGHDAQVSLLGNYAKQGIDTIGGVVSRWAPTSDGNDVAGYAKFVAGRIGIGPNDKVDLSDPSMRSRIATAMAEFENGTGAAGHFTGPTGGIGGDQHGPPPSNATAGITPPPATNGSSGIGGLSPEFWTGLTAAGLGMMASRSPFPGVAIGEGGLRGLSTYAQATKEKADIEDKKRQLDIAAKRAQQQMDYDNRRLALSEQQGKFSPVAGVGPDPNDPNKQVGGTYVLNTKTGQMEWKPGTILTPKGGAAPLPADAWKSNGEDFLKYLPPDQRNLVRRLASYNVDPKTLSVNGGERERLLGYTTQYDPNFDQKTYNERYNAVNKFATGPQGQNLTSLNTTMYHLDTLGKAADALNNGNTQAFNQIGNFASRQFGYPAVTNFNAVRDIAADEVVKSVLGTAGSDADRQEMRHNIQAASSPAQLRGVIEHYQDMMAGRLHSLRYTYKAATGNNDEAFDRMLTPETRERLGRLEANVGNGGNGAATPPPASGPPAAPVRVKTPAEAQALTPGTRYVTPDGKVYTR